MYGCLGWATGFVFDVGNGQVGVQDTYQKRKSGVQDLRATDVRKIVYIILFYFFYLPEDRR
jgi:hypothetical protein